MTSEIRESLKDVVQNSAGFLLDLQDKTGGWAEFPGKPVSVMNTAEAIVAILDAGAADPGDARIALGIAFLTRHQTRDGEDAGAWFREFPEESEIVRKVPDILRTSFAIQALIKSGAKIDDDRTRRAVDWLLSIQRPDGGWPFRRGGSSELIPTCFVLMSLLVAYRAGVRACEDPIKKALTYLGNKQARDGSFGSAYLVGVYTVFAALVLQRARKCGLPVIPDKERFAIEWMLRNGDDATRPEEQVISIDESGGPANYSFLFLTDTMLIEVLTNSMDKQHGTSLLANRALTELKKRILRTGGISGPRVFSWSTAKAVSALVAAENQYAELPRTPPELPGTKASYVILPFAVLLVLAVTYLSSTNSLGILATVVMVIVLLALLLAQGLIGEQTFKELAQGIISRKK